jgi:hypothetical protein
MSARLSYSLREALSVPVHARCARRGVEDHRRERAAGGSKFWSIAATT